MESPPTLRESKPTLLESPPTLRESPPTQMESTAFPKEAPKRLEAPPSGSPDLLPLRPDGKPLFPGELTGPGETRSRDRGVLLRLHGILLTHPPPFPAFRPRGETCPPRARGHFPLGVGRWDLRETVPERGAAHFPLGQAVGITGKARGMPGKQVFPSGRTIVISGKLAGYSIRRTRHSQAVYTEGMKASVSLPDDVFEETEHLAAELQTSRSQLIQPCNTGVRGQACHPIRTIGPSASLLATESYSK
jgi:hypothetical protein